MRGYLLPGVNGGHVKETKCRLVDGEGTARRFRAFADVGFRHCDMHLNLMTVSVAPEQRLHYLNRLHVER